MKIINVKEMVVMFLHVLVHDVKNREIQREFVWSGQFNLVLLVVLRLHDDLLAKPQLVTNACINSHWRHFEVTVSYIGLN